MGITIEKTELNYRLNVAFILEDCRGQVLIGERRDHLGSWQFPQGGKHKKESLEEALCREVEEEIHLSPPHYSIQEFKGPYCYLFPEELKKYPYVGQQQYYFRALLLKENFPFKMKDTSREFQSLRWIHPKDFQLNWLPCMKRPVYVQVFKDFYNLTLL